MNAAETADQEASATNHHHKKRNVWLFAILVIFVFVGLGWFFFWFFLGRFYENTDDCYVHGNQVYITPQVAGSVTAIFVEDTDLIREGQLIATLDTTNYEMTLFEDKAQLAMTVRNVAALFEAVREKKATVAYRKAELIQRELDLSHREGLINSGAISVEEFEDAQTNVLTASAALALAEAELESANVLVQGTTVYTHPDVLKRAAMVRESFINLERCAIRAPVTGYVGKRSVQVGKEVAAGEQLMVVIPLYDLWAEANFRETKIGNIRIGQKVTIWADIYGRDIKYYGTVVGFSPGTGDAFALLPPQNASGNWIKIIQRLPIRVSLSKKELEKNPLMLGLSLHASVDIRETDGDMLSPVPVDGYPIYQTEIFDWTWSFLQINQAIDQIILDNIL
ncbi:MAG: HlyD family efflux transporter periplasmic adaptor subunit [Chlamydiia bacterium]|nr:HlyD family efflux transporter periplasmic adaptor subunit [Chlamydiia bacterium]